MNEAARWIAAMACCAAWLLLVGVTLWRHSARRAPLWTPGGVLVVYASQTGTAAALAEATAQALTVSGRQCAVQSLAGLTPDRLAAAEHALFVVATTGEGDAPDDAVPFLRQWASQPEALDRLNYALLALGDRNYRHFCAFGHALDRLLREAGAKASADLVEVDQGEPGALRHWQQNLRLFGASAALPDWEPPRYGDWQLAERELLNPGSPGAPMFRLRLTPRDALPDWSAGDIAEVYPGPAGDGTSPLPTLSHRDYTIATIPQDGAIDLTVRLFRDASGQSGLGSGWLCERAGIGQDVALRIRSNPHFHAPPAERPLILIGNGTGISGLLAHVRARPAATRNWLIFGERDPAKDRPFAAELQSWGESGHLERLDRVFSRGDAALRYVQHAIAARSDVLRDWTDAGAAIFVCGSVVMGNDVDAALRAAVGSDAINRMKADGRYRRDIY